MFVYGRCHFCQGSKESEGVEGIKHCACCVGDKLWKTSYLHYIQVNELISCVTYVCQFLLRIGEVEILGEGTVAYY